MVNSEEFQYPLPEEAIATEPVHPRRAAKMLVRTSEGEVSHHTFEALPVLLQREGVDGLWANDTKVLHARILATKTTGGGLEVFLLSPESAPMESVLASSEPCRWKAMVRNAKRWTDGHASVTGTATHMTIEREARGEDGTWTVRLDWDSDATFAEVLEDLGKTPLPPYMRRAAVEGDKEDYQTVFAMAPGSVAAPTAGLHFDDTLLSALMAVGLPLGRLTLHVGAGTFKPLTEGDVEDHVMHAERCVVARTSLEAMAPNPNAWPPARRASARWRVCFGLLPTIACMASGSTGSRSAHPTASLAWLAPNGVGRIGTPWTTSWRKALGVGSS